MKVTKILLIEDSPVDFEIFKRKLSLVKSFNAEIIHSQTLTEAKKLLTQNSIAPSIIFLDLGLPDGSGLKLIDQFETLAPLTPLVVLTGQKESEIGLKAIKSGAADFICKDNLDEAIIEKTILFAQERRRFSTYKNLASKQRALNTIASNLCDQIGNPLAILSGRLEQLNNYLLKDVELNDSKSFEIIENMKRNIKKIEVSTQNLSKFSSSEDKLDLELTNAHSIITNTLNQLSEFKEIQTHVDDLTENQQLNFYKNEALEVLFHICKNAYEAAHTSTDSKWISIKAEIYENHLIFTITNSGLKISSEDFIAYQEFYASGKKGHQGLGLSLAKQTAESFFGDISTNDKALHTEVQIRLPIDFVERLHSF